MEQINKTIVITYDDGTRMIDFCKTAETVVSKDFYDWYLKETPNLFTKNGMLIIDNILGKNQRCAISFDASNPDEVIFTSYVYHDQSVICSWVFKRQENLTMEKVSFDIKYLSLNNLKKVDLLCPANIKDMVKDMVGGLELDKTYRKGFRNSSTKELIQKTLHDGLKDINKITCQAFIYYTYALMYYVSKQEPEEITSQFKKELDKEIGDEKVKSIYKYTGYIDLRENKTYKPIIKKDPTEPVREYERHIQSWTVRGHYRNTKNGRIWIEPHIKGEGELEKRIYGTEDEKDLNLIPKVFEVMRTKKEEPSEEVQVMKVEAQKPFTVFSKLTRAWAKIISFFSSTKVKSESESSACR